MKLYFKPMPWLTVFSALSLILLLKLGFWQKDRLAWKTDLLARVEAAAQAPAFTSLNEVMAALTNGDPVDYRRYAFETNIATGSDGYYVYDPTQAGVHWRAYERHENSDITVYIAGSLRISDDVKDLVSLRPEGRGQTYSSGYVRLAPKPAKGLGKLIQPKPNPESNRWFAFNQNGLWQSESTNMEIWLDEHRSEIDLNLPVLLPDIRNNHRDYMWTWFSLAGLLIIFYGLIHYRAKRLSWGKRAIDEANS